MCRISILIAWCLDGVDPSKFASSPLWLDRQTTMGSTRAGVKLGCTGDRARAGKI